MNLIGEQKTTEYLVHNLSIICPISTVQLKVKARIIDLTTILQKRTIQCQSFIIAKRPDLISYSDNPPRLGLYQISERIK